MVFYSDALGQWHKRKAKPSPFTLKEIQNPQRKSQKTEMLFVFSFHLHFCLMMLQK